VRHGRKQVFRSWLKQDKGHVAGWKAFAECITSGNAAPISFDEIIATTLATIRIADSIRSGQEERVIARVPQRLAATLVS
jgi:hypothetical protein